MELSSWIILSSILLVALLIGVLLSFYFLQEKLIFSPIRLPRDYEYPFDIPFEERNFEVEPGIQLNALLFRVPKPKGLIFYIHGNAENLRYWGDFAHFYTEYNYDVLMYDFRGFGKSDGQINGERSLQKDAKSIYQQISKEYGEERCVIYGFSIGTGIAARLASNNQPKLLILEAPYFNFIDLVKYHKAYLPADLISKYHFRTNRYLPDVNCPIAIFHGTEDRKVPFYSGKKLVSLNPKLEFFPIEGATHSDMQVMEAYTREMKRILD